MEIDELDHLFRTYLPDEDVRCGWLETLADHIRIAHAISPRGWVVFLERSQRRPVFMIRNIYTCSLQIDLSGRVTRSMYVFVNKEAISADIRARLQELKCSFEEGFKTAPHGQMINLPLESKENFLAALESVKQYYPDYLRRTLKPGMKTSFAKSYDPKLVEYLRYALKRDVPHPAYYEHSMSPRLVSIQGESVVMSILVDYLCSKGYRYSPEQIARFYTALQTKGFVILSGISGTGKTRLAQYFAALLNEEDGDPYTLQGSGINDDRTQPTIALVGHDRNLPDESALSGASELAEWWTYPVRKDVAAQLSPPFNLYIHHNKKIRAVYRVAEYRTVAASQASMRSPWPELTVPKYRDVDHDPDQPGKVFKTWFRIRSKAELTEPYRFDEMQPLFGYSNNTSALRNAFVPVADPQHDQVASLLAVKENLLFLSVRPDWRDSKALLGYYNPLLKKYEWTPFLRFLCQAAADFRENGAQAQPWFVILDEMNLARVEYYFADLLSVLESGRESGGWTHEAIRLAAPPELEGDSPPDAIRLPPNLYIIGTVNVDETTHAFSPKVLDRAFTLELTEVDFGGYPPSAQDQVSISAEDRGALLEDFSRHGEFACIDKNIIAEFVAANPIYRERLDRLNRLLCPHDLHFGYRVFDEIIMFMAMAESNGLFSALEGSEGAFDAAVAMKILPKFHGSRGRLEAPLLAVLAWCQDPITPDLAAIKTEFRKPEFSPTDAPFGAFHFAFPVTAGRVVRMLSSLLTTGFAAFG